RCYFGRRCFGCLVRCHECCSLWMCSTTKLPRAPAAVRQECSFIRQDSFATDTQKPSAGSLGSATRSGYEAGPANIVNSEAAGAFPSVELRTSCCSKRGVSHGLRTLEVCSFVASDSSALASLSAGMSDSRLNVQYSTVQQTGPRATLLCGKRAFTTRD